MSERDDAPSRRGFRFSALDAVLLAAAAAGTAALLPVLGDRAWLVAFVAAHFFLFCNVFRIPRRSELVWAGALVVLDLSLEWTGRFSWTTIGLAMTPLTVLLVWLAVRDPGYRGVRGGRDEAPAPERRRPGGEFREAP
jgi:hypothetical protein